MSDLTMNQELDLRKLSFEIQKASREQLMELCLDYAKQLYLQQNAAKELYKTLAIDGVYENKSQQ